MVEQGDLQEEQAYVMLLNRVGIESARITGNGHVWTGVKLDGK